MELLPQDVLVLAKPNDALTRLGEHLHAHPDAQFVAFLVPDSEEASEDVWRPQSGTPGEQMSRLEIVALDTVAALLNALLPEKVVAAEPQYTPSPANKDYSVLQEPQLVSCITQAFSIFKTGVLRDHLDELQLSLGPNGSAADISLFLNQFGLSSVGVPVPDERFRHPLVHEGENAIPRTWDAYVAHVDRFEQESGQEFARRFASLLSQSHEPHVLIDATDFPAHPNGTSRNVIGFLRDLNAAISLGEVSWHVTVIAPKDALESHSLTLNHIEHIESYSEASRAFDLGIALTPVTSLQRCASLTLHCLRWTVLHLDAIALRSLAHRSQHVSALHAMRFYLAFADRVFFISDFSRNDALNLLGSRTLRSGCVISQGVPDEFVSEPAFVSRRETEIFVAGNDQPHKQTRRAARELLEAGYSVTSISSLPPLDKNHTIYRPGELGDAELKEKMASSAVVVFPSLFEGFGLPIAEAIELGSALVLWDTEVSREVAKRLDREDVVFCSSMDQLVECVRESAVRTESNPGVVRRMSQFNADLRNALIDLLNEPLSLTLAMERWNRVSENLAFAFEREMLVERRMAEQLRIKNRVLRKIRRLL